jgi:hypothetical protein
VALTWKRRANSRRGRWYPSTTRLPNGKVLITGGTDEDTNVNTDIELYSSGSLAKIGSRLLEFYPLQQLLRNGKVLAMAPDLVGSSYLINASTGTSTQVASAGVARAYASGVLLPGGYAGSNRMMIIGGANHVRDAVGTYIEPHASTQIFDGALPGAGWQPGAALPEPRIFSNVVILPDGTLLAVGGENAGLGTRNAALYDPISNSWRTLAAQTEVRSYHASAVLLPDGRVLSCGDNHPGGGAEKLEIFSPPYLFRGPRPVIISAPLTARVTTSFTAKLSGPVRRAVLVAPGASTHSFDMSQRHVELAFTTVDGGIKAKVPAKTVAIPGYYMFFVMDADGVPSVARWIRVTP